MSYLGYISICRDPICLHLSKEFIMKTPVIYYAALAAFCILTLSMGIIHHLV